MSNHQNNVVAVIFQLHIFDVASMRQPLKGCPDDCIWTSL